MTTVQDKDKLNVFEKVDSLKTLHDNSRRVNFILHTDNPCFLQCWYPSSKVNIPGIHGPVFQFTYNGGKRSPLMDKEDAIKLLLLSKEIKSCDPDEEITDELKVGRVKLSQHRIWFIDSRSPRYDVKYGARGSFFIDNLINALNSFIFGAKDCPEYPALIRSHKLPELGQVDTMFVMTSYGLEFVNSRPSWLKYEFNKDTDQGDIELTYGNSRLHISSYSTKGVNWIVFIKRYAEVVLQVIEEDLNDVNIYEDHPLLSKYKTSVYRLEEARLTYLIFNTDMHTTDNKVMIILNETNKEHLKLFFNTILKYHA